MQRALRRLRILDQVQGQQALLAFAQACGPRLLSRVRPERFSRGTLFVRVQSSAWANEIHYLKTELLLQLRKVPGGEAVREILFTVGPLDEGVLAAWPALVAAPPPAPERPRQKAPVDPRVAAALTQVKDGELRDLLGGLYVTACHAGKRR